MELKDTDGADVIGLGDNMLDVSLTYALPFT